jgi:hypothetical protein
MSDNRSLNEVKKRIESIQQKRPEPMNPPPLTKAPLSRLEDEPDKASASDEDVYFE